MGDEDNEDDKDDNNDIDNIIIWNKSINKINKAVMKKKITIVLLVFARTRDI